MRIFHNIAALCISCVLLVCLCIPAQAHDVPDLTKTGEITVSFAIDAPGGTLYLYRVGDIHGDDGNYSFVPLDIFARQGIQFDNLQSPALAEQLYAVIQARYIAPVAEAPIVQAGRNARCRFEAVEPGLYLIAQGEETDGYFPIAPFLAAIPYMQDGVYRYDIDASSKSELKKEPEPVPETPNPGNLPQTGQLNWPVPVLAALGLAAFTAGWYLFFNRREQDET